MINIQRLCPVVFGCLWLAACGSADAPREPPPVEETVFRDVAVTAVEKARDVQNVVDEHKLATDRAIEESESGQ